MIKKSKHINGDLKLETFSDEEDKPLAQSLKRNSSISNGKQPPSKKIKNEKISSSPNKATAEKSNSSKKVKDEPKLESEVQSSPKKGGRKSNASQNDEPVWEWWKDRENGDGQKWKVLEHNGPMFDPGYIPIPHDIRFYYNGKPMKLSEAAEEVATFYSKMLDHDYTAKPIFNTNFLKDWQGVMTSSERETIRDLKLCDFREMSEFFKRLTEERKNRTKEEKNLEKKKNEEITQIYGFCNMDGHRQKIANFRIEPPGLFRGRGDHPKMGMLKCRIKPEDVTINCSKGDKIPIPPPGTHWKEVRHDPTVSWLACWIENIQGNFKYVMLNASSKLKGEKDWKKYETARQLHLLVDKIRAQYEADFKHKEMRVRQRAVALYFIDKLALRAGNEKDEDEADTVGCCSLRVEHIKLHEHLDDKDYVVEFDFLGKDSIRYQNSVPVVKRVFKNLNLFLKGKQIGDDLFDRLNTTILNQHLRELMPGLTAKVFRTYNASKTLEEELEKLTNVNDDVSHKLLSYNRANRSVAILCNHQRAVPKTFAKSMENIQNKIREKKDKIAEVKQEFKKLKAEYDKSRDPKIKVACEKKKKSVATLKDQLSKLETQATDKDENKEIALGTSKLNYLDPRISVAWCKKFNIPIEKMFNKTQREKFQWAIDMATKSFVFRDRNSDLGTNKIDETNNEEDEDEYNESD